MSNLVCDEHHLSITRDGRTTDIYVLIPRIRKKTRVFFIVIHRIKIYRCITCWFCQPNVHSIGLLMFRLYDTCPVKGQYIFSIYSHNFFHAHPFVELIIVRATIGVIIASNIESIYDCEYPSPIGTAASARSAALSADWENKLAEFIYSLVFSSDAMTETSAASEASFAISAATLNCEDSSRAVHATFTHVFIPMLCTPDIYWY